MNLERLKLLEEFVAEDPENPFNIYALALENKGYDNDRTKALFESLLVSHPGYLPAYYPAGVFFLEQGFSDRAAEILTAGFALAQEKGERKTANEIRSLLDDLD